MAIRDKRDALRRIVGERKSLLSQLRSESSELSVTFELGIRHIEQLFKVLIGTSQAPAMSEVEPLDLVLNQIRGLIEELLRQTLVDFPKSPCSVDIDSLSPLPPAQLPEVLEIVPNAPPDRPKERTNSRRMSTPGVKDVLFGKTPSGISSKASLKAGERSFVLREGWEQSVCFYTKSATHPRFASEDHVEDTTSYDRFRSVWASFAVLLIARDCFAIPLMPFGTDLTFWVLEILKACFWIANLPISCLLARSKATVALMHLDLDIASCLIAKAVARVARHFPLPVIYLSIYLLTNYIIFIYSLLKRASSPEYLVPLCTRRVM